MRRSSRLAAALIAGALLVPALAAASVRTDASRIRKGLTQAQRSHWVKPDDAIVYRAQVSRALGDLRRLPPLRATVIANQLWEVGRQAGSYVSPRAAALFGTLRFNLDYLESHALPRTRVDVPDAAGVVYRWFGMQGFQLHPLADFGALNAAVTSGDPVATQALADALVARGVPRGATLRWEYYFPFGGGRPPWLSGMAQAVAAQALARAGQLLNEPALLQDARRAYAAVAPGLLLQLAAGPWIRLYAFDREIVFNAQLQAVLSLYDYADATDDPGALNLAAEMDVAAQTMLPRFDTGYWSLYELGGREAPLDYEQFVTQLLIKLAQRTQNPVWQDAAARFYAYVKQPPQVVFPAPPTAPVTLYPRPADGWLDSAPIAFTLSKRSKVTLAAGGRIVTATFDRGAHTLTWKPGTLAPGTYAAQLVAVDLAGNRTTVALPQPFVVAQEQAPQVQAQLQGNVLAWQGVDPGTPKLRLQLALADASGAGLPPQTLDLGFHSVSGTANVALPTGTWQVTLTATNTAKLAATVDLGQVTVS